MFNSMNADAIFSNSANQNHNILTNPLLLFLSFIYLAFPVILFLAGWFRLEIAAFGIISLLILAYLLFRSFTGFLLNKPSLLFWLALLICFSWVFLSGVGHFVYSNRDWLVRDAVLRDLVVQHWPVIYQIDSSESLLLRAPLGYYLPAAIIGKLTGVSMAHIALAMWTLLGVLLTLSLIASFFSSFRYRLIAIFIFIGFSGLDLIGILLTYNEKLTIIKHLEWWANFFQYSSHTTQLFWVPNHALPGWLGMLLLLRYWNGSTLVGWFPAIMCAAALWSPLAALGLIPFYLAYVFVHRQALFNGWPRLLSTASLSLPFGLPIAYYLTFNAGTVPGAMLLDEISGGIFWSHYLLFVALEFGILAILLLYFQYSSLPFWIAVAILIALPFISFGPGNDLAMRASIPALVVLALATAQAFSVHVPSQAPRIAQIGLFLVMLVGAMTAVQEIARSIIIPRWEPSTSNGILQVAQGAPHYLTLLNADSLLARMLRRNLDDPFLKFM